MEANTTALRSVYWEEPYLRLLDQRMLPEDIVYLQLHSPDQVWEAIQQLKVRGAPAIGITAAFGIYLAIQNYKTASSIVLSTEHNDTQLTFLDKRNMITPLIELINDTADYLATSRPTAINLFWALERMKSCAANAASNLLEAADPAIELKAIMLQEAMNIQHEDEETCRLIGEHALTLFEDGMGILTHCNAGGLATAKYGTALSPFYLSLEKGMHLKVYADETRPVLQGARLTAFELMQAGVDVTLICDNMAGMIMAKGWIQAVIVGTDRVAANGDVANKIGTYSVAVLAKAHGIPFYVACPMSTIDLQTPDGANIPIEERHGDEITVGFGKRTAPQGVKVYNPAFDITPHEYVTAIITEKGIIRAPYSESLNKLFSSHVQSS